MIITTKKVTDLHPYGGNTKTHDNVQISNVATSIAKYGFVQPIVVDKEGVIVIGHCRYAAALKLHMDEVPCVCVDDLTPEQVRALRIVDNKSNESPWDADVLKTELDDIFAEMADFDFDFSADIKPAESDNDKSEVAEVDAPEPDYSGDTRSHAGDVWKLGRHTLMVGDSTDPAMMRQLMDGEDADLVVTDPPYNVALGMGGSVDEARKRHRRTDGLVIMNDKMEDTQFRDFLVKVFTNAKEHMKPGAAFYIWHADNEGYNFRSALIESGLQLRQTLVWAKSTITLGRQDYQWQHEPCLYGWKDGAAHYFIDDRTQSTVYEDAPIPKFSTMKKDELVALLRDIYSDKTSTTIIHEDKPSRSDLHPTMKPVKLIARQVRNSSRPGDLVLDQFGGSGTTLITCEQTNRRCKTMELDPRYADVIIKRWEEFTGQTAERMKL